MARGWKRMKVLVHACCGPCSIYPVEALSAEGMELRLFFFNPNIHPYQEFRRRLESMEKFARVRDVPLIVDTTYDLEGWLREVVFREARRCTICYRKRLEAAARVARRGKFEAFTTTLLYSKHQKHELVRELAEAVSEEAGVPFLYRDFRQGWKAGIEASKRMGLYRQQYCGCIFSERDRYLGSGPRREAKEGP